MHNDAISSARLAASPHDQMPVVEDSNHLLSIMARQNNIFALWAKEHNISRLPRREIQMPLKEPLSTAFGLPGTIQKGTTTSAGSKLSLIKINRCNQESETSISFRLWPIYPIKMLQA